jgi:hypothetical protein
MHAAAPTALLFLRNGPQITTPSAAIIGEMEPCPQRAKERAIERYDNRRSDK